MNKYFSIVCILLGITISNAQDVSDALRYSLTDMNGTARFRSLSGAFGALGGDLSAISVNPASSVIFNNNQVAFSLNNYNTKNSLNYFGTTNNTSNNSFDINQAGGVFVFKSNNSEWKKFALSLNYENQNNFDNSIFISGTNPTNSIEKYFLYHANLDNGASEQDINSFYYANSFDQNGDPYEDYSFLANYFNTSQNEIANNLTRYVYQYLGETGGKYSFSDQQAFLGFETYIIDIADDYNENTNRSYKSLVAAGGNYYHENSIITSGYNGKLAFNFSANYQDKLMIGLNLNSHFTDYIKSSRFFERNNNNTSTNDYVKRIYFDNDLHTYGNGFSFQLGAILKLNDQFRLGASYESPTWHKLTDELTQSVVAVSGNNTSELPADIANPNLTMIYPQYTIKTPGKVTGSAAIIFGKQGLISFDYSIKDYSSMRLKPENDYNTENSNIESLFTTSNEIRIGGEYKIEKWSLRAGFRSESSPYNDKKIMGDLKGYSAGIGYNFGGTKLDFAYSGSKRDYSYQMFNKGLTDGANSSIKNNNFTATLSFEL